MPGALALILAMAGVLGQEPTPPRQYTAHHAASAPVVDGRLDDAAWVAAPWSDPFVDIEGDRRPPPRWRTRVKLLWDSTFLYVGAELEEPELWGTVTTHDAVIFQDNDFEVFLDPDGDGLRYFELEINSLGTVWDLFLSKPYRDGGHADNDWDIAGLRSAVALAGTLNDPSDRDRGWTVELALPWRALAPPGETGATPHRGDEWRINFSRVEWNLDVVDGRYEKARDTATGRPAPEMNWVWSPQGAVNMHLPERWGFVRFSDDAAPRR
jgi:hypothetical protein